MLVAAAAVAATPAPPPAAAPLRTRGRAQAPAAALPRRLPPAGSSGSGMQHRAGGGGSSGGSGGRRARCRGFVGEGSRIAGEYHDADFDWEELVEAGRAAVQRQRQERAQFLEQQAQQAQQGQQQQSPCEQAAGGSSAGGGGAPAGLAVATTRRRRRRAAGGDSTESSGSDGGSGAVDGNGDSDRDSGAVWSCEGGPGKEGLEQGGSWERFHSTHSQARFFKEKRYLMLEFPALGVQNPAQHIVEIGCGCGSALLPVLKANPTCRVTGCDISPTALQLLRRAAEQAGVDAGSRIRTFVLDASSPHASTSVLHAPSPPASSFVLHGPSSPASTSVLDAPSSPASSGSLSSGGSPLAGLSADSLLLIFTLSALRPEDQPAALAHAHAALRPGGLLLFRDYGLYDMAQLRFPGAQMLGENLYRRSEGTLAYYFSTEALRSLAAAAGFEEVECQYARVEVRNRKNGTAMRRVFVHGVFRKPLQGSEQ